LASNGFGRLELNYHKIVARAYSAFNPIPSEAELQGYLREYAQNYLLFIYGGDGQIWGQWDTPSDFLPKYKTANDRRSPTPPEPEFSDWKKRYRNETKSFVKCFGNVSESFLYGKGLVGYGVGKGEVRENICASPAGTAHVSDSGPLLLTEPAILIPVEPKPPRKAVVGLTAQQEIWFEQWWAAYWLHKGKKVARQAFGKQVRTVEMFERVMAATAAQSAEMLRREPQHRPHGSTWINQERWEDESAEPAKTRADVERDEISRRLIARGLEAK